eukprot:CAMPEP_0206536638 /NCGR_PEP_ID=MMETSP0325_2-20121206/6874_1 /ASSEMBLY_ACC=CAM_ASM_000347 /TAXON_ID=2866 /ORGANISM="Crypthecodinium cohnii, Strain Seligo" /LENGTH=753 /DNA_ID=CAMNT_0054033899 /DNA_START=11 /DNA_END=2272 /DNA_ORIENTATION=+
MRPPEAHSRPLLPSSAPLHHRDEDDDAEEDALHASTASASHTARAPQSMSAAQTSRHSDDMSGSSSDQEFGLELDCDLFEIASNLRTARNSAAGEASPASILNGRRRRAPFLLAVSGFLVGATTIASIITFVSPRNPNKWQAVTAPHQHASASSGSERPTDLQQLDSSPISTAMTALEGYSKVPGYNCFLGNGGEPLGGPMQADPEYKLSFENCSQKCSKDTACQGFVVMAGQDQNTVSCWLRQNINVVSCIKGTPFDLWAISKVAEAAKELGEAASTPSPAPAAPTTPAPPPIARGPGVRTFTQRPNVQCHGLSGGMGADPDWTSIEDCHQKCLNAQTCAGYSMPHNAASQNGGACRLHETIPLDSCSYSADWDTWLSSDGDEWPLGSPQDLYPWYFEGTTKEAVTQAPTYFQLDGYDCWGSSKQLPGKADAVKAGSPEDCQRACDREPTCDGFILGHKARDGQCWLRSDVALSHCAKAARDDAADFDFWYRRNWVTNDKSPAPTHEFYMYRAVANGILHKYPVGEENMANMDGVLWYLANEIVTNYSHGVRCPRRFGIEKIVRFKVRTTAPAPLYAEGMNFGIRYAYDQGQCAGRCFEGNKCTGEADCALQFNKYGYFVGCNRFVDQYPFPSGYISAPGGVWYSVPLAGRCAGNVTGQKDCTWSYEMAGELTLAELETAYPGNDNCCDNRCTDFWRDQYNIGLMGWRVEQVKKLFAEKYPDMPGNLVDPPCDFDWHKWYENDHWPKADPWE